MGYFQDSLGGVGGTLLLKGFAAFMRMINQNEELLSFLGQPLLSLIPASDEKKGEEEGESVTDTSMRRELRQGPRLA